MSKRLKKWVTASFALTVGLSALLPGVQAFADKPDESAGGAGEGLHLDAEVLTNEKVSVIVELDEQSVLQAKHEGKSQSEAVLKQERERIFKELEQLGTVADVTYEYDQVFSGFSIELPKNEIGRLLSINGVKAVYPNEEYEVSDANLIDFGENLPEMMETAPYIESHEAWDAGYTGEGVTVAVIDTGVDFTHPDLSHAFGDYLGWDFVDNDPDPQETLIEDVVNPEDATNHGTHVAGTIAANGDLVGVAPDATLLAYRVLGPGGKGSTDHVIAAIERAVEDGADIMNLSLGASLNNPDYPTSLALDTAMAEGVVAVTSNGNDGPNDWTVGSPGTSREAISVGATQLPYNVFDASLDTPSGYDYSSTGVMGFPTESALTSLDGETFEFVHAGLGSVAEFNSEDVAGKIALISRGELPFVEKAINAANAGAVGAIIYNNVPGDQPEIPGMAVPTLMVSLEDGQTLLSELETGNNTLEVSIEFSHLVNETIADFSSRGPVMDNWMVKPDVVAPGVNIVSTVPGGYYASMQGTSMSSPHVAGAAALILEAHPDWSVEFVKASLMNTAERLTDPDGNVYPHNAQGAGSVRVLQAIEAETLILPGSHSFGIFEKSNGREVRRQGFDIHNLTDNRKKHSIEFTGNPGVRVNSSNNFNVQPGRTQTLNFNVQVDASSLDASYNEGTFVISDGTKSYEMPTMLFIQEPDFPLLNSVEFGLSGDLLIGLANLTTDVDEFALRVRNADTGELVTVTAVESNVPRGEHFFLWDMTIDGEPLPAGRYALNPTAKLGDRETELPGGVLTLQ